MPAFTFKVPLCEEELPAPFKGCLPLVEEEGADEPEGGAREGAVRPGDEGEDGLDVLVLGGAREDEVEGAGRAGDDVSGIELKPKSLLLLCK